MKALTVPAALAAALGVIACGDSSPASPFTGATSLAEEAAGTSQSPIDIRSPRVTFVNPSDLPALDFRYGRSASLDVVNTGSPDEEATVRAEVTAGGGTLRVGESVFELLQFHWHTPSEHLINGKQFPLEMHLVHQNAGGELLVIGVLIRQGNEIQRPLERIFRNLPDDEGEHRLISDFNLPRLLPERHVSARYGGSLTTPPFTEPVSWIVLKQPIEMTAEQIDAFRDLFEEGNAREPQPLHGRRITADAGRLQGDDPE
jgi:carbonic anhydrase